MIYVYMKLNMFVYSYVVYHRLSWREKLANLKYISVRLVLSCLGDVYDEVLDADYFASVIQLEQLLVDWVST